MKNIEDAFKNNHLLHILVDNNPNSYVYRWNEISTGMMFLDCRTNAGAHKDDGFICNNKKVLEKINANPQDWYREILFEGSATDAYLYETQLLQALDIRHHKKYYNRYNNDQTYENIDPIRKKYKHKRKNHGHRGVPRSPETREKISKANKGRIITPEQRKMISDSMKGHIVKEETREKIAASKRGKKRSAEVIERIVATRRKNIELKKQFLLDNDEK